MTTSETRCGESRFAAPGFTLIELLLVVVIVALAAGIVYPALGGGARRLGVTEANYELLCLLRRARWWSASTGRTCLVTLRPAGAGYRAEVAWTDEDNASPQPLRVEWARLEHAVEIESMMRMPAADGSDGGGNELTIRFTPAGVREDYVITLAGAAGQQSARIEISRPGGLIRMAPADADEAAATGSKLVREMDSYWQDYCRGGE